MPGRRREVVLLMMALLCTSGCQSFAEKSASCGANEAGAMPVPAPFTSAGGFEALGRDTPTYVKRFYGGAAFASSQGDLTLQFDAAHRDIVVALHGAMPVAVIPEMPTGHVANYFIGPDPGAWRRAVPTYAALRYVHAYPGIDVLFRASASLLRVDVEVAPRADPSRFGLKISGTSPSIIDACGDLVSRGQLTELHQTRPVAYQVGDAGDTSWVAARWRMDAGSIARVAVGSYDTSRALVIDPTIIFSTYLGGSREDRARSVAIDAAGNSYVAGSTGSTNFYTRSPAQSAIGGLSDVFVTKFDPNGVPIYSTYVGGQMSDEAQAIAVDATGNVVVGGFTDGSDFPTTPGTYQGSSRGGTEGLLFKLAPGGNALTYSTYIGGTRNDVVLAVTLDASGNALAAGATLSSDFPSVNAVHPTYTGNGDAFVLKLSATGAALLFSTFLGGTEEDQAYGVALGPSGDVYIAGQTVSADFPVTSAMQGTLRGTRDAFVARLGATGTPVRFATYYGGAAIDFGRGIRVDALERATVVGYTTSSDLPTRSPIQGARAGGTDTFLMRMTSAGTALDFGTYLGGSGEDFGGAVAIDNAGGVLVAGHTTSANFPVVNALQGVLAGPRDGFVARLAPAATAWTYSTYLGGSAGEFASGVAATSTLGAVVVGSTEGGGFPLRNAFQSGFGGVEDAFVTRIEPDSPPQQSAPYEYVGKVVCGAQPDSTSQAVVRGFYATVVNVRNPGQTAALFRKQVIWTYPPGNEKPVKPIQAAADSLLPGLGFATDCRELLKRTNTAPTFHEGLLIISTNAPLDVIGVYTAAPMIRLGTLLTAGNVSSIHTDRFPVRRPSIP